MDKRCGSPDCPALSLPTSLGSLPSSSGAASLPFGRPSVSRFLRMAPPKPHWMRVGMRRFVELVLPSEEDPFAVERLVLILQLDQGSGTAGSSTRATVLKRTIALGRNDTG